MTTITTRFASRTVGDFLREAPHGRKIWFLAQGEPQCLSGSFMKDEKTFEFENRLFPGLRGVRVGEAVASPEEAIARAAKVRADLLSRDDLEPFDEAEAGVDDEAIDIAERFDDVGARIEEIIHVGAMIGDDGSRALRDFIDELEADDVERLAIFRDIPFLHRVAGEEATREDGEGEGEDDEEEPEIRTLGERVDEFIQLAHDHGTMGFIVEVSVPHRVPHGKGGGASIHLGTRYVERRYGSTFRVACDRALEWASGRIAEMMATKAA